jgi:putative Mg2+ transporter-C (MgtC) family protein
MRQETPKKTRLERRLRQNLHDKSTANGLLAVWGGFYALDQVHDRHITLASRSVLLDAANLFQTATGVTRHSMQLFSSYWTGAEVGANATVFLNILGSLFLGLIVGYERSYRGRAAGMRTYALVCMASCSLTVITGYPEFWYGGQAPNLAVDPGRIIHGVCTGVGFLGAGVIMRDGLNISGLTTAASIWAVSAIGVLVGVGFYSAAILMTCLCGGLMMWGWKIEALLPSRHAVAITLHFNKDTAPSEEHLNRIIHDRGYEIAKGSFSIMERDGLPEWRFVAVSLGRQKSSSLVKLSRTLSSADGIHSFHISHARN